MPEGTATVLLGPSGAGKTTLLRALAGFLPLVSGRVRLGGTDVAALAPEHRGLGFVPPNLGLFPHRRVRENVAYPLWLRGVLDREAQVTEWLRRFDLERLAARYPHEISTGERQRVAMARALAAGPQALLWDEPLAALDVEARDVLVRLLRELLETERIPLLLVTHDPSTAAALASRFALLESGDLRFTGPPEQLVRGHLDRFAARFLGFENLYGAGELTAAEPGTVGRSLADQAGPSGLVVPPQAIRWGAGGTPRGRARVAAVRWTSAGWVVALREGALLFHVAAPSPTPGVRVGDVVSFDVDPTAVKPLVATYGEEAS